MPSPQEILSGLTSIANEWRLLATGWHVYFAVVAIGLTAGLPRKHVGALLVAPLVSAGALAWTTGNWFNGGVLAAVAILLAGTVVRDRGEPSHEASPFVLTMGVALFLFGFAYPHFLQARSWFDYLLAAPLGLLPCPTLAAIVGVTLMSGLSSNRAWSSIAAATGVLYGAFGVFRLGVTMDLILLAGALVLIVVSRSARDSVPATKAEQSRLAV